MYLSLLIQPQLSLRCVPTRPYHPQSQGVIENPNGVLKKFMRLYQGSHPQQTDWTFIMAQVVTELNHQIVHSVTRMNPNQYFHQFDPFIRVPRELPAGERVVITVAEVATRAQLAWIAPCGVLQYDRPMDRSDRAKGDAEVEVSADMDDLMHDNAAQVDAVDTDNEMQLSVTDAPPSAAMEDMARSLTAVSSAQSIPIAALSAVVELSATPVLPETAARQHMVSQSDMEPAGSSAEPTSAAGANGQKGTTSLRAVAAAITSQARRSVRGCAPSHFLLSGEIAAINGGEWERDLMPQVRQLLWRQGAIANGDCGPAAGYAVQYGSAASKKEATELRRQVFAWSNTTEG